MRAIPRPATIEAGPPPPAPPLHNGDRLGAEEFLRRYSAMPDLKKAELIHGSVYLMASPVSAEGHGEPHSDLITWLGVYRASTPGVRVGDNVTIVLSEDDTPQPDGLMRIVPECGGQCRLTVDDYIDGPPELVAEVARSSVNYDLHDKLDIYQFHGVREYLVWRTDDAAVDWFVLRGEGGRRRL